MTPVHFTVVTNFVLALIPFLLALYLFKYSHKRTVIWWGLSLVFVAFLPNAAYVLTDIIHFVAAVKSPDISTAYLLCVLVPFYVVFLTVNFEFYVLSVSWVNDYIKRQNIAWLAKIFVPSIHFLSALGVYLGRFQRLESYDILHKPLIVFKDVIDDLTNGNSLLIIMGLFCLFYGLYMIVNSANRRLVKKFSAHKSLN